MPKPNMRHARVATRGAIFVESIVIITFLSIFMAGALFFHRLYLTKHYVMQQARLSTWSEALSGCEATDIEAPWPKDSLDKTKGEGDADAPPQAPEMNQTVSFVGAPKHISPETAAKSVKASSLLGGRAFSLSSRVKVACNEEPRGTSAFDLGDQILDAIPPIWQ
jgi:hypothetical protein